MRERSALHLHEADDQQDGENTRDQRVVQEARRHAAVWRTRVRSNRAQLTLGSHLKSAIDSPKNTTVPSAVARSSMRCLIHLRPRQQRNARPQQRAH